MRPFLAAVSCRAGGFAGAPVPWPAKWCSTAACAMHRRRWRWTATISWWPTDERNTLVTYQRGQPAPVALLPLGTFLGTAPDQESDLEGAAAIGSRIYWISSHGRNKNGKQRKERQRFFATEVDASTVPPSPAAGRRALHRAAAAGHDLGRCAEALQAQGRRAACTRSSGRIQHRGPGGYGRWPAAHWPAQPPGGGRALLVPLDNPEAVINGKSARIGAPILLDLGGRGIRSIERMASATYIVAGASGRPWRLRAVPLVRPGR